MHSGIATIQLAVAACLRGANGRFLIYANKPIVVSFGLTALVLRVARLTPVHHHDTLEHQKRWFI